MTAVHDATSLRATGSEAAPRPARRGLHRAGGGRRRSLFAFAVVGALALTALATPAEAFRQSVAIPAAPAVFVPGAPIQHVVILYQENHSFDNVLGKLCVVDARCDGATTGRLLDNSVRPLAQAADVVPNVAHSTGAQQSAINGGAMNGFQRISGCTKGLDYRCYSQFAPEQIPNLSALARTFGVSDRTFELDRILTFGAHLELASANLNGFDGTIPSRAKYATKAGPGWGCDSMKVTGWRPTPSAPVQDVPPCVPFADGSGSWWDKGGPTGTPQKSPVGHIGNIFDTLDGAGLNWRVYNATKAFDLCSYFASCQSSQQAANTVPATTVLTDARNGQLPNVSFVMPNNDKVNGDASQHNQHSMAVGDNWIGDVVSAIANGPNWKDTAIFITYDDCGCFYDHVAPPTSRLGIRLPMVIVSPFAKPAHTDSNVVSFVGMLAFTEHMFGLAPMSPDDANSYDYMDSFDFSQQPLTAPAMVHQPIPAAVMKANRAAWDADDPT